MKSPSVQTFHGGYAAERKGDLLLEHGANNCLLGTRPPRVQVLARAGDILRLLKTSAFGFTQVDIASQLQLPRTTVNRIIMALHVEGLVEFAASSDRIRLGREILTMVQGMCSGRVVEIGPIILALAEEVDETVDFALFERGQAVLTDEVIMRHRLRAAASRMDFPLHCTAIGKAMLAAMTLADYVRFVPKSFGRATENTITSRAELDREVARIRKTGIAYDCEESNVGIGAVAVSIQNSALGLSAVAIPIPMQRFRMKEKLAIAALRAAAVRIKNVAPG